MTERPYQPPPPDWIDFGTHADPEACEHRGALEWSFFVGEDGLPRWERHDGCPLLAKGSYPLSGGDD